MNRRLIAVFAVALIFAGLLVPAGGIDAVAAAGNNSTASDGTPGPYSISDLREGGLNQGIESVPSVRALGEGSPKGFAAVRFRDPTTFDAIFGGEGQWQQVEPGITVHENEIQLYGSAFGEASGEYTVNVVYWTEARRTTGNGTQVYAGNQTLERHRITFDEDNLYSYANLSLPHHSERTWQVTMWLTKDNERVDGARWRFQHRSNPKDESVAIDSKGDAWGFALRTAVIPGGLAVVVGLVLSRWSIQIAGRGPGYGVGFVMFITVIVGSFVMMIAYFQIAVILNNLPYVMGISMGVISYGAGLTFHEPEKRIGFLRRELKDAQTIPGGSPNKASADGGAVQSIRSGDAGAEMFDEFTEAIFLDLPEVPAVRTPDGYRVPVRGIFPFFARLFSDAALLDLSNIATRQKVKRGRLDDIIVVNPESEFAVKHKSARLVRVLPWDTLPDDASGMERVWAMVTSLAIVFGPPIAGGALFGSVFGIPWVGAIAGIIPSLVLMYSAEDGWIEFDSAPPMYTRAEDSLTLLQRAFAESEEEMSAQREAWDEKAKSASDARAHRSKEAKTVSDRILESMGVRDPVEGPVDTGEFEFGEDRDEDDDDDDDDDPPAIEAQ